MTPLAHERPVLDAYARVARPIELRWLAMKNSCIASTWIAVHALDELGIEAKPFPVKLKVLNALRARRLADYYDVHPADLPPSIDRQRQWQAEGAHEIGIGFGGDKTGYDGHLVAMTRAGFLLDPSLDQCDRPAKNLGPFPPLVAPTTSSFRRGERALIASDETGAMLWYWACLNDTAWQASGDWEHGGERYGDAVDEIVQAVRLTFRMVGCK